MSQEESLPTDLEVEINTTYYAQDISEAINRRIGTVLICFQFLLGSSAMVDLLPMTVVGFLVASISAIQAACKFPDKAAKNRACKLIYSGLMNKAFIARNDRDIYEQIEKRHFESEIDEPQVSHGVLHLAEFCARQKLYKKPSPMRFTLLQRAIALFAGVSLLENT